MAPYGSWRCEPWELSKGRFRDKHEETGGDEKDYNSPPKWHSHKSHVTRTLGGTSWHWKVIRRDPKLDEWKRHDNLSKHNKDVPSTLYAMQWAKGKHGSNCAQYNFIKNKALYWFMLLIFAITVSSKNASFTVFKKKPCMLKVYGKIVFNVWQECLRVAKQSDTVVVCLARNKNKQLLEEY